MKGCAIIKGIQMYLIKESVERERIDIHRYVTAAGIAAYHACKSVNQYYCLSFSEGLRKLFVLDFFMMLNIALT